MKLVVLSRGRYLFHAIEPLIHAGHEIRAIATGNESPGYDITSRDYREQAASLNIPFLHTANINSEKAISWLREHNADLAISMNWHTIINQECRSLFKHGIINIHIGDLPRYRGNATPNWSLLNGEDKAVLTLHIMDNDLDAGPILLQHNIPITEATYIGTIYQEAEEKIPELLIQAIESLANSDTLPQTQSSDSSASLRCYPRLPRDGEINWNDSADHICRLVRASAEPFAGAFTYLGCEKITIWRARMEIPATPYLGVPGQVTDINRENGEVTVICGDRFLVIEEVEINDTGRSKADCVIISIRCRLGMDMPAEILRLNQLLKEITGGDKTSTHNRLCNQL